MLRRLACTAWPAAAPLLLGVEAAAAGRSWTVLQSLSAYGTANAHRLSTSSSTAGAPEEGDQQRKAAVSSRRCCDNGNDLSSW